MVAKLLPFFDMLRFCNIYYNMQKLKVFFNWFLKVGISILLVLFLVVAPFSVFKSLLKEQAEVNRAESFDYQGILELWHIETFEGGSVSRSNFLERQAIKFEKEHKGTYVVIETMNLEQYQLNLESGKTPNILSFGIGIGDKICDKLINLDDLSNSVRSDLLSGGMFNHKQLAIPYILGGYAIMSKNVENISGDISTGIKGTTNPLCALKTQNITNKIVNQEIDSFSAYDKFLKGDCETLLGTQRDVYRIYNRQQKGLLTDVNYKFLSGYSDLLQYLSVVSSNEIEQKINKLFVQKMLNDETQTEIEKINMFSVLQNKTLYKETIFCDMEKALSQNLKTKNAFLMSQEIDVEKQKLLKEYL